jgi:L-alanine-DL-glutamate epimerase-like enolase superfamily enzyme
VVLVEVEAGGELGLGYSYADVAAALIIGDRLAPIVEGGDPAAIPQLHARLAAEVGELGRGGIGARALSAVDAALWDLRARLLGVPLCELFGRARDRVAVCGVGSAGLGVDEAARELGELAAQGYARVTLPVGARLDEDAARVRAARHAIGTRVALGVDAGGALARKQVLALAGELASSGVSWLEEPVGPADRDGLKLCRDRAPAGMTIAAGATLDEPLLARELLEAGAVDALVADLTRCGGPSGFLRLAALCDAFGLPLAARGAPGLTLHVACAAPPLAHLAFSAEHARIEALLFDGAPQPDGGWLYPDRARPGHGLRLKRQDAQRYLIAHGTR